jgi:hypothetical protein
VAKFNPSLSGSASLVYATYLGGGDGYLSDIGPNGVVLNDLGQKGPAIAVDASGDAFVAGATNSGNFPTTPGAFQTTYHAGAPGTKKNPGTPNTADAFVTKLNPTGSALVYSTYLSGSSMDGAKGIALDAQGNAYITGYTRSTDFPLLNPLQSQKASGNDGWGNPNADVFVTTLNASGSALLFSTYLGGASDDSGNSIAVNSAGDAYVTGGSVNPTSSNFPTTPGAFQTTPGNGFVLMIDPPVGGAPAPSTTGPTGLMTPGGSTSLAAVPAAIAWRFLAPPTQAPLPAAPGAGRDSLSPAVFGPASPVLGMMPKQPALSTKFLSPDGRSNWQDRFSLFDPRGWRHPHGPCQLSPLPQTSPPALARFRPVGCRASAGPRLPHLH